MTDNKEQKTKTRVLVIDDSKVMRIAAKKILDQNFDVVLAEDGKNGWDQISVDETIQVVFSDLSMPNMDGYGLLERVRNSEDERIQSLPVIIITGKEQDDDTAREEALDRGATDFILKPFNSVDLKARATAHATSEQNVRTLKKQSGVDPLTGLYNRRFLLERLVDDHSFAVRHNHGLMLMRMDIDDFNHFFIKQGKETSDYLIKQVSKFISSIVRREDTLARIGPGKFAVVMPGSDLLGAKYMAERVRGTIDETTFNYEGQTHSLTMSIGISTAIIEKDTVPDELFHQTEKVLSIAMENNGNQVLAHDDTQKDKAEGVQQAEPPVLEEVVESATAAAPGLDEAVSMIQQGQGDMLKQHLQALFDKALPLLKLADSEQLESLLNRLKK